MSLEIVLCHWLPNWGTNKVMSACIYALSWSTFCDVTLPDRFMPVVMTVRNASSTHKISAAYLFSDAGIWLKHEHTRYWFRDFQNLGTGACGVVIGANFHRMNFCLAHTIAEWSKLLKQNIWMKSLHAFGINRHKIYKDVSCLCQYYSTISSPVQFTYRWKKSKNRPTRTSQWSKQLRAESTLAKTTQT